MIIHWFNQRFLSLKSFYATSGKLLPWLISAFSICFLYGLIAGLFFAPADYQQGDGFRIIYVHAPSAFTAMAIYAVMATCGVMTLVFRMKIAAICMSVSATIGAWFTFLALVTGSIWGKPMWGTWWIWDARLTSELILLFLYMGYIGLYRAIPNPKSAAKISAIFALMGVVDIPIIHYSVYWWNTLHQGATISQLSRPTIDNSMLYPLLSMIVGFGFYALALVAMRVRTEILQREQGSHWIQSLTVRSV